MQILEATDSAWFCYRKKWTGTLPLSVLFWKFCYSNKTTTKKYPSGRFDHLLKCLKTEKKTKQDQKNETKQWTLLFQGRTTPPKDRGWGHHDQQGPCRRLVGHGQEGVSCYGGFLLFVLKKWVFMFCFCLFGLVWFVLVWFVLVGLLCFGLVGVVLLLFLINQFCLVCFVLRLFVVFWFGCCFAFVSYVSVLLGLFCFGLVCCVLVWLLFCFCFLCFSFAWFVLFCVCLLCFGLVGVVLLLFLMFQFCLVCLVLRLFVVFGLVCFFFLLLLFVICWFFVLSCLVC